MLPLLLDALPDEVVEDSIIPIGLEGDRLVVGVLDSCDDETLEKVRFICNRELKVVVVTEAAMAFAVQRYLTR